jgi:multiple sugar transport system substrate-binding protein
MKGISRRSFFGVAAATIASPYMLRYAQAQETAADAVTRGLPRTYAGRSLSITWGSTPAYAQISAYCSKFSEATGIELKFVPLQQADRYQKMVLDATSNTNSFDVSITAYQWKDEIAPYFTDLSKIDQEIKGIPPLELTDYPQNALDAYSRVDDKLITMPLLGDASLLVWNKKAFQEAGLPDTRAVPSSSVVPAMASTCRRARASRRPVFGSPCSMPMAAAISMPRAPRPSTARRACGQPGLWRASSAKSALQEISPGTFRR